MTDYKYDPNPLIDFMKWAWDKHPIITGIIILNFMMGFGYSVK